MSDLDVDRVLAGLRAVAPVAGMEARVLLALEQQEVRGSRPLTRHGEFWSWISREWFLATGVVAAVLLVVSPLVVHTVRRGATRRRAIAASQRVLPALPRVMEPSAVEPRVASGVGELPVVHGFRPGPRSAWPVSARKEMPVAPAPTPDARMESFPAPPMPLTRQERLLLRMLNGGQTAELMATLSAGAEEAMDARNGAHRLEFFSRPRPAQALKKDEAEEPGLDAVGHMGPVAATPGDSKEMRGK